MLPHEAFVARRALVLPVVEVRLHVRLDILLAAKPFTALIECTYPLVVPRVRPLDILLNVVQCDTRLRFRLLNIDRCDACRTRQTRHRLRPPMRRAPLGCFIRARGVRIRPIRSGAVGGQIWFDIKRTTELAHVLRRGRWVV